MAYLKELVPRLCRECRKPAKVALVNGRNAFIGDFCRAHGNAALKKQAADEVKEAKQQRALPDPHFGPWDRTNGTDQ